MSKITNDGLT